MKWPRFDLALDGQSFDHDLFIIIRGVSAWTIMLRGEKWKLFTAVVALSATLTLVHNDHQQ